MRAATVDSSSLPERSEPARSASALAGHDAGAREQSRRDPWWWALALLTGVVAFGVRYTLMARGGGLVGVGGYDDGVYYAAADSLVHGRLPYRDFLLLQPPGIAVLVAPFAWLGSLTTDSFGLVVARLAFMVTGAVNAVLVAAILRRFGARAALVGGIFYAVLYPAAYSERSTLLEPLGNLGVLVALLIMSRERRAVNPGWVLVAGAALGAASAVKIWYVVSLLVILAFHPRAWRRLLGGAVVGVAAFCLPFFAAAPQSMFREVVLDEVGRARSSVGPFVRLEHVVGAAHMSSHARVLGITSGRLTAVLLVVLVALLAVACTRPTARLFVALLLADIVVLIASPPFFAHYAALTAPPLALVVGSAVAVISTWLPQRWGRSLVALALLAAVALNLHGDRTGAGQRVPLTPLRVAAAHVDGCVMADDPTILAVLNVLSRDLSNRCALWPDVTGWTYDADRLRVNGGRVPRTANPMWQRHVLAYLRSGSATILIRPKTGLNKHSLAAVQHGRVLSRHGHWVLYSTASKGTGGTGG